MNQEKIEEGLTQFPICEYAFINIADITFLDQVRYICKTECPQYGKSWSCPPAVGTVEECKKRCSQYTGGLIFTTIAEVNDIANMEETLATRMEHEKITRYGICLQNRQKRCRCCLRSPVPSVKNVPIRMHPAVTRRRCFHVLKATESL